MKKLIAALLILSCLFHGIALAECTIAVDTPEILQFIDILGDDDAKVLAIYELHPEPDVKILEILMSTVDDVNERAYRVGQAIADVIDASWNNYQTINFRIWVEDAGMYDTLSVNCETQEMDHHYWLEADWKKAIAQKEGLSNAPKDAYGIGEEAPLYRHGKRVGTVTINSVRSTTARNQNSDKSVADVVHINYTYRNELSSEDIFLSDLYFQVIDSGGNVCSYYSLLGSDFAQDVPLGAKLTTDTYYGIVEKSEIITFIVKDKAVGSGLKTVFMLPVE